MKFNLNSKKSYVSLLAHSLSFLFSDQSTGQIKKFLCLEGTKQLFDLKQDLLAVVLFILLFREEEEHFRHLILFKGIRNIFEIHETFHKQLTVTPGGYLSAFKSLKFQFIS